MSEAEVSSILDMAVHTKAERMHYIRKWIFSTNYMSELTNPTNLENMNYYLSLSKRAAGNTINTINNGDHRSK